MLGGHGVSAGTITEWESLTNPELMASIHLYLLYSTDIRGEGLGTLLGMTLGEIEFVTSQSLDFFLKW